MSDNTKKKSFEEIGEGNTNIVREFVYMFKKTKKYWMIPIVLILLLLSALVFVGGTSVAPFIYTLF